MKKLNILITWILMSITANAQSLHFDVNNNGSIDLTDALLVVGYILGRYTPEDGYTAFSQLGCPDGNHPHMIDLGLPSGTKWACCNVGARRPNEYGRYYAWGETYGKDEYTEFNYDFCSSEDNEEIPIWDRFPEYENIGEDICGSKYDVAHKKWGKAWQMPSIGAIQEIIENCSFEWVIIKGIKGGKFTGPNDGCIFLPASGEYYGSEINLKENHGYYWSGSIDEWSDDYSDAGCLIFHQLGCADMPVKRFSGYTIRPIASNNLILASLSLSLSGGEVTTVEITSGSGNYSVESSKEEVATASIKDNLVYVTAVGVGCAKITVTDTQSGQKATIHVNIICPDSNHPHTIDLGLSSGNLWACCNVGANKPEDYGTYYLMEEIEGEKACEDIAKWGDNWDLPTANAILELQNECSYSWASINGIEGLFFTGPNENGVFFPAAGVYFEGEVGGQGYCASYWLGIGESYRLSFDKNSFYYQPLLNKYNYDSSTTARLVQEQYEMND